VINAQISAEIDKSLLGYFVTGDQSFNDISFLDSARAFGIGTITSVIDPPDYGIVTISLYQIETSQTSVPEPATMLLLGLGLIGLAGIRRKYKT
jgi:hypothetical protein